MADDADWIRVRVSVYDRCQRQRWRTLCRGRRRGAAGDVDDDRLTKFVFFLLFFLFVFFTFFSFHFFFSIGLPDLRSFLLALLGLIF